LINEALKFYKSDENTLVSPSYKFNIDKPEYLSDVQDFIKLKINTKDSLSLQAKALKIYRELLAFHSKRNNTDALAMADLERINFVYEHAVFPYKDTLYLDALTRFIRFNETTDVQAWAYFYKADFLNNQSKKYYSAKNEKFRWEKKEALQIIQTCIDKYPESRSN